MTGFLENLCVAVKSLAAGQMQLLQRMRSEGGHGSAPNQASDLLYYQNIATVSLPLSTPRLAGH